MEDELAEERELHGEGRTVGGDGVVERDRVAVEDHVFHFRGCLSSSGCGSQPLALAAGLRGTVWPLGRHPGHDSVCDGFSVYRARHYQGNLFVSIHACIDSVDVWLMDFCRAISRGESLRT